jgi:hypothetical protein
MTSGKSTGRFEIAILTALAVLVVILAGVLVSAGLHLVIVA